jgi:hypothetical protein
MKIIAITFVLVCLFFLPQAQQPQEILRSLSTQRPIEKVYVHCDRNEYLAGQTIWFKAYLYADFVPADRSTSLYVELLNSSSDIISRQVFPVFSGFSRGQLILPDTIGEGNYMLRAYTSLMLNYDPEFLYKKQILVFNKNKKAGPVPPAKPVEVKISFFPEGGNFIAGLSNSIAFKATDEKGLPIDVKGVIKKENEETVTEFSSLHDGMGYFDLAADEKANYYAVLIGDPSGKKYSLPKITTKGVVLRVINTGVTKQFEILQRNDDPFFKAAYMVGQMQHHMVFKTEFKESKNEMTGTIRTDNLSSGILQITVFNKNNQPIAERLTFVDNREYIQNGELLTDTISFSDRGFNRFTLSLKDTVKGSFSVSVSDLAFDASIRKENIVSALLLTSDIKGYVHNPAWYFSSQTDSAQNGLDLVMMTNGWRRFRWEELKGNTPGGIKYADTGFITLAGRINIENTKKPLADRELMALIITADSSRYMQLLQTNAEGRFSLDSMVFFGAARILLSDIKGRKSKFIDVKLDGDSLNRVYHIPKGNMPGPTTADMSADQKMKMDAEFIRKAEGVMLGGVTVTARKKTKLEETEEKYVSPLFGGNANHTLDVTEENLTPYRNIFDYLQLRVPGLQISNDGDTNFSVTYRQQASVSSMGELPMAIFLNEVPVDVDVIAAIPANQVALVKVFSSFVGAFGNAPGGVLAIYTKKGTDRRTIPTAGEMITYNGYSVVKEFYSPDYSVENTTASKDDRMTLYWNPSVLVADINAKIPIRFYNNDRTRQFRVVIEGMTMDGKMLMIEKIISPSKGF